MASGHRRIVAVGRIRQRLTIAFLLAATLPALVVGVVQLTIHLRALETIAIQHVDSHLAVLKEKLDRFLNIADRDLRSLHDNPAIAHYVANPSDPDTGSRALATTFLAVLRHKPDYYRLRYVDRYGTEVVKIRRLDGSGGFREAADTELNDGVGAYLIDRFIDTPRDTVITFPGEILDASHPNRVIQVFTFARPLWSGATLHGILVLDVLAENYFRIVESSGLPPLGVVAVADREGHYLYHSGYRRDWNLLLASRDSDNVRRQYGDAVAARLLSGEAGRVARGKGQLISFLPFRAGDASYVLFYEVPERILFAAMVASRRFFYAVLLVAALAAAMLAGIAARRFTEPINALRAGTSTIASGDLTRRIEVRTGDEIEDLAHDFNAMADAIQQRETNLRSAERDLAEAKRTLQTIFDGIKAGIRLISADHRVIAANQYNERLIGKTSAEMIGNACWAVFDEQHTVCASCPGNVAMRTGAVSGVEFERPGGDGQSVILQVDAYPVFGEGRRPAGFIEFIQDISEKRRLERQIEHHASELETTVQARTAALRESEERYRDLVENSPEMIHLLSPDGRFLHANKTEREKLGYTLEELCARSLDDLVPSRERQKLVRHRRELAARGRSRVVTTFLTRAGEPIEVEIDATAQFEEGRLTHARAFVRDITERKRMEERLFQTEKMVSLGQLVSGIAHEIGTPLNAISGTAELLLLQDRRDGNREDLEAIVVQTGRISKLVRQLLDFARPSRSRRMQTDVHEVLRSTLHLLARPLSSSGVGVRLDLTGDPVATRADAHQLQQVFINILLNAQQAMPDGGTIRVSTRVPEPNGRIEIVIEDSGPGIPEQHLKTIFEPFFTTKEVGKGTGLGLAICATIVQRHSGALRAENAPNGARFIITLPLMKGGHRE